MFLCSQSYVLVPYELSALSTSPPTKSFNPSLILILSLTPSATALARRREGREEREGERRRRPDSIREHNKGEWREAERKPRSNLRLRRRANEGDEWGRLC